MKGAPTVSNEDDARIRRAESLRSRHPAASEFLEFYKHVVSFQKRLRANMARANQLKSGGVALAGLRDELDLTVLLPHFRGYLSVVESHAPHALAESARQFALLPSESWISSLEAYWQHAGIYDQQVGAFAQFPGVLAALRRVPRFAPGPGPPPDNPTALSAVRVATPPWRAAEGGRRRKTLPAVLVLLAGMGVPENPLPDLRRRSRRQVTGVCRRRHSPRTRGGVQYLQVLSAHH